MERVISRTQKSDAEELLQHLNATTGVYKRFFKVGGNYYDEILMDLFL
jgi:hypothetical protein